MILLLSIFLAATPALAQEEVETVTGKDMPALENEPEVRSFAEQLEEYRNREFEAQAYWGEDQLGMEPRYVHQLREGLELVYLRRYSEARDYFADLDEEHPETLVSALADTLIWQALMMENFDFKYEKQWEVSSKRARRDLATSLDNPGNEGFEHFMLAGIIGVESIHTMRRERYLPALQLAFEAMDEVEKSREAAPNFVDLKLADGMFNYWRSVITITSSMLPDFGDHRLEGIAQMQEVESGGVFLGPAATLAMVFTWLEERNTKRALSACLRNQRKYPDNVINNLVLGQTYTYKRKFPLAIQTFDHILETDENNTRARYWKGVSLLRSKKFAEAEAELTTYLETEYMEDWQKASAHYRLGQVYNRTRRFAEADAQFRLAVKANGHKAAKAALDRLRTRKKEGRIDY